MKKIFIAIITTTISFNTFAASAPTPSIAPTMVAVTAASAAAARTENNKKMTTQRKNILSDTLIGRTVENCHIVDAYYHEREITILCMNVHKNEIYLKKISNNPEKHGDFSKQVFEILRSQF